MFPLDLRPSPPETSAAYRSSLVTACISTLKGRSSGSGVIIRQGLPGFPVVSFAELLHYSGGTAGDLHPFPFSPAAYRRHPQDPAGVCPPALGRNKFIVSHPARTVNARRPIGYFCPKIRAIVQCRPLSGRTAAGQAPGAYGDSVRPPGPARACTAARTHPAWSDGAGWRARSFPHEKRPAAGCRRR